MNPEALETDLLHQVDEAQLHALVDAGLMEELRRGFCIASPEGA